MAIIQRPTKQGGATTFQGKVAQGYTKILASEADADIDTIFAAWNGGADTVNLRDNAVTSAKIAPGAVGARELADGSIGLGEINQTSLAAWVPSGLGLTPAAANQQVVIPGPTASSADNANLLLGTRTQKGRVQALPGLDWAGLTLNRKYNGSAWSRDDTTQPSWTLALGGGDQASLSHEDAAGNASTPFVVRGSDGKTVCTLADKSVTTPMLALGASVRQIVPATVPLSYALVGGNAWTDVATVAITTTGGPVVVIVSAGWWVVAPANTDTFCMTGLARDQVTPNIVAGERHVLVPGTGNLIVPLAALVGVDTPPAGLHTYHVVGFCPIAGVALRTAATWAGQIWLVELA
jgi:hypothetical protein